MALDTNDSWKLVFLLLIKQIISCKWIFTVKVNLDEYIICLKVHLISKGYAQTYSMYYFDTFSPIVKLVSIHLFVSLKTTYVWSLH